MTTTLLAGALLPLLVDVAWKATVLLLVALAAAGCLRRASAARRHLMWAVTLVGLLVLPALSLSPDWRVVLPEWSSASSGDVARVPNKKPWLFGPEPVMPPALIVAAQANKDESGPEVVINQLLPPAPLPRLDTPEPVLPTEESHGLAGWLVWTWGAGVLLSVLWCLAGWCSLARLVRKCQRVEDGPLHDVLSAARRQLGIGRTSALILSKERAIPMTWGLWRPVVLLPEDARLWPRDQLLMVLVHELAHVQRRDCLVQMLGHLARGLFWFHPLAWLALHRLRIEQEHACDDLVVASGANAPDYAEHLLTVTAGLPPSFWTLPVALGMGRSAKLQRRLLHLLDSKRDHRTVSRRALLFAGALVLALVFPLGRLALAPAPAARAEEPKQAAAAQPAADQENALLKKLTEVRKKLAEHYVAPLDDLALADQALKGLLQGLKDPYTDYLSAEDLKTIDSQMQGRLTGIGIQIHLVDNRLVVATPLEDSPAFKAGLRPGDHIDAIDGQPTRGQTLPDAVKRILGPAGTVVKLKIIRPEGVVEEVAITRAPISLRTVVGFQRGPEGAWQFLLDEQRKIGYLHIQQFNSRTAAETRTVIADLQKQGLRALVLDLRFCPGGLLDQALGVCKLFLGEGLILTTRGPGKVEKSFRTDGTAKLGDFPLLVLINEHTASAAEIVAGSLRDHNRAVLLGSRSFGKGSVQSVVKLDVGGALKVTTAYHYIPSGRNIQKRPGEKTWGVDPSEGFYVPLSAAQTEALRRSAQKLALLDPRKEAPARTTPLTPKLIEEQHADPQLAAGLRSMVARLTGGEFLKVGKEDGALAEEAFRLEEMRARREKLLQSVGEIEREIAELQRLSLKDKKGP